MMNRNVMQRQMFANGGAAFPDLSGDGNVTQKDILMGRGVIPMAGGGDPMAMPPQITPAPQMAPAPEMSPQDQMMMNLQVRAESLGMPLDEYISILQNNPSFAEEEANRGMPPVQMQQGGMAPGPMGPPPMPPGAAMAPPGAADQGAFDPAVLEGMLADSAQSMQSMDAAAEAGDYASVINSIRGDEMPIEARYEELAGMVGPEDSQQTPESVLTLLQPVMQMAAVDQGIGGLAQEEMTTPIEGPMAEGIMSTVNMEGPPPGPEQMAMPR